MAHRKWSEVSDGDTGKIAKLYSDGSWGEYIVKFHLKGVYQKDADYHTSDRMDALNTAMNWVNKKD
ncbi:hypothetical protein HOS76_gp16 [Pseudomonas phage Henninger]|uniref:Uncharacterized protein n=1 Tax=Pseudomonas phage Henninger TaxID=2079287 RepID=A0A2K9VHA3_9CAUD|nr:hypothetical protein HOS76_gp16 [Pseudomonas phage Henninger]AUV61710.1 hypothetical protein PsPhHenninger_gp37 [Pseudomonas phage Henninger]